MLCTTYSPALQHLPSLWEVWEELEFLQSYFGAAQRVCELESKVGEAETKPTSCLCPQTQAETGQGFFSNLQEDFDSNSYDLFYLKARSSLQREM